MKIVVIGSSNIDMVAQVSHLPAPGETVGDACFMQLLGGKGANQAVAAARLGASVTFITSLGNDMYADILKKHFTEEGINTNYIIDDSHHPTGTARRSRHNLSARRILLAYRQRISKYQSTGTERIFIACGTDII